MTFGQRLAQLRAIIEGWTDDDRIRYDAALAAELERIRGEQAVHGLVHALWALRGR